MNKETIIKYYDYTLPFYRFFYHKKSNSIHYGFWDKNTKSHQEALINVNKFLAKITHLKSGDLILDAGCGIGGSSIWLTKNYDVKAIGITISDKQVKEARRLSQINKVEQNTDFYEKDFLNSGFDDETFDVVWAIESVCHAENKKDFLREAYRMLKNGGRLVVDDGFLLRDIKDKKERKTFASFLEGMALPNLAPESQFRQALEEVGFKNIQIYDKVREVLPSSKKIYQMSIFSYPLSKITEKLHLTPHLLTLNNLSGIAQYQVIKSGLAGHRVFYAEK
jgi:cyclopropane fatty-acyl-phospholipid synthase-like methyltransferase